MSRTAAPESSSLRPVASARPSIRECCGAARGDLRMALLETGHTQLSFATALGISQQRVSMLLDPTRQHCLSDALVERIRLCPETRDVYRWLGWLLAERTTLELPARKAC